MTNKITTTMINKIRKQQLIKPYNYHFLVGNFTCIYVMTSVCIKPTKSAFQNLIDLKRFWKTDNRLKSILID